MTASAKSTPLMPGMATSVSSRSGGTIFAVSRACLSVVSDHSREAYLLEDYGEGVRDYCLIVHDEDDGLV